MAFFKFRKGGEDQSAAPPQPESIEAMRRRAKHRLLGAAVLVLIGVVGFPILFDRENKVSQMYSVNAMPSSIFIDRKGNVRYLHRGYKAGDESEYLNQIRALLKE